MDKKELTNPYKGYYKKNKIKKIEVGRKWESHALLLFAVKNKDLGGLYE